MDSVSYRISPGSRPSQFMSPGKSWSTMPTITKMIPVRMRNRAMKLKIYVALPNRVTLRETALITNAIAEFRHAIAVILPAITEILHTITGILHTIIVMPGVICVMPHEISVMVDAIIVAAAVRAPSRHCRQ